ncbi:epoxyqueuosine reductase [Pelosinus sp. sgz500959]|uniref:epoxyqueuosine reductase n=1 Tax=Pelosinus sp. sgz500959 TaxID=3242472 RepID=UPI00366DB88C
MKNEIISKIMEFISTSEFNKLPNTEIKIYDSPLIGFADVNNNLFENYQQKIGPFHMTPQEWFTAEFENSSLSDGTVICWILPFSETILKSNYLEKELPSKEWAQGRFYGEQFNDILRQFAVSLITKMGYRTIAPSLSSHWKRIYSDHIGHASTWSERHAAYAAGLGTFSLTDALITEYGMAMRVGSVITELVLAPSPIPYKGVYDNCLHYNSNRCGACIHRCPAGAISLKGHNKDLCFAYTREKVMPAVNDVYGVTTPSCGLCQTKVPCERSIPKLPKTKVSVTP